MNHIISYGFNFYVGYNFGIIDKAKCTKSSKEKNGKLIDVVQ